MQSLFAQILGPIAKTTEADATNTLQIALLAGGVVALIWVLSKNKQRGSGRVTGRLVKERHAAPAFDQMMQDLGAAMSELDQFARQIHSKIDLKIATLQKIIRDADQRIEELARMRRATEGQPTLDVCLGSEAPQPADPSADSRESVYRLADSGYTPFQIARELSRHTGEVELILSLRRAKNGTPAPKPASEFRRQVG